MSLSVSSPFGNQIRGGIILGTQELQSPAPSPFPAALQVFPACRLLPDTVDVQGPSCVSWLCPLPWAPARSALLACPQGRDLYLCSLQLASQGTSSQGLRVDSLSKNKPRAWGCTLVAAEGGGHC